MSNLSGGQIFALCFASGVFFVFSSACAQSFSQTIGILLCMIFMLIIIGIASIFAKNKTYGTFSHIFLLISLILSGAGCVASFYNAESSADFGINHKTMLAVLLGVAVIYCASLGIKASARCAVVISALSVFAIFLLILGAFSKLSIKNLQFDFDVDKTLDFSLESFCLSALTVVAISLIVQQKSQKKSKYAFLAVALSGATGAALSVLYQAIGADTSSYFSLFAQAQPFAVQSGEWIYIIIYGMLSVLTLSLIITLAVDSLKSIFPKIRFASVICAGCIFALAAIMPYADIRTKPIILASVITAMPSVLFGHSAHKKS